ncbi:hypothetical protein AD006_29110 (plasmid) [Pseudonocardia sp. EC080610-09]|uniref:hypothetical protein n=1 Tax=unclassified Pseudonocardia TaxID=2619320 RepID=UPI000705A876|nr:MULTISPECIES: hypothetical protein [unclassified Pseudonocardia]ALL79349.1 hypothetical protein AD006_29110 [Pseudonocardia sp. EC080610-09]ALL85321.1 hypothetical protein AD017_29500 [Pseudonocardia sp. EC080619-01]
MAVSVLASGAGAGITACGELAAQDLGGVQAGGIVDDRALCPAMLETGGDLAVADDCHRGERGRDLDEPADHPRVDRVVTRVDTDAVVAGQPSSVAQPDRWCDRRKRQHRGVVGVERLGRAAADRADRALVRSGQPAVELLGEGPWVR